MKITKTNILISTLTAAIMFLIPIVALAADPPALVPKAGQTTSYAIGDDGYYQTGKSAQVQDLRIMGMVRLQTKRPDLSG
jgi:hypothetical protein